MPQNEALYIVSEAAINENEPNEKWRATHRFFKTLCVSKRPSTYKRKLLRDVLLDRNRFLAPFQAEQVLPAFDLNQRRQNFSA